MSFPTLAAYACLVSDDGIACDLVKQVLTVRTFLHDEKTGLYWHGYDEKRTQRWADPKSGHSSQFWSRAMGWFAMALVDIIDRFEAKSGGPTAETNVLRIPFVDLCGALFSFQSPSGMWWQVTDQADRAGNYLETSASLMFAYVFLKGARLGILERQFVESGCKALEDVQSRNVSFQEGTYHLTNMCWGAGLGAFEGKGYYRDGSYEYYIHEKVVENDPKGVAAFMMAWSEWLALKNEESRLKS